jgi:hypothetical protein
MPEIICLYDYAKSIFRVICAEPKVPLHYSHLRSTILATKLNNYIRVICAKARVPLHYSHLRSTILATKLNNYICGVGCIASHICYIIIFAKFDNIWHDNQLRSTILEKTCIIIFAQLDNIWQTYHIRLCEINIWRSLSG